MLEKSEIHLEADIIAAFMCQTHEQEEFIMFCQKDKVPICRLCMINEHQGHSIVKISDAADSMREEINVEMHNTHEKLDEEELRRQKEMSKVRSEVAGFLDDVESTLTSDHLERKSQLKSIQESVRYMLDLELIHKSKSIRQEAGKTLEAKQSDIYNEYVYYFVSEYLLLYNVVSISALDPKIQVYCCDHAFLKLFFIGTSFLDFNIKLLAVMFIPAFTTNAMTLDFLSSISPG